MPNVSVVIPAYNSALYLKDAIDSVIGQTYDDHEIIIVDDGSTDNTREVVANISDDRIRYVYEENQGLAAARNTGITFSTGEYIALLDADDMWLPDFLQVMTNVIKQQHADGAYCGFQYTDQQGNPFPEKFQRIVKSDGLYASLQIGNFINACSVVMKCSKYIEHNGFDQSLKGLEDWDMWLRISKSAIIVGVETVHVLYRQHQSNMSKDTSLMADSWWKLLNKHFGHSLPITSSSPLALRKAYTRLCLYKMISFLEQARIDDGGEEFYRLLTIIPEVAHNIDLFYTLACAHQPRETRGKPSSLDWSRAQQDLLQMLSRTFLGRSHCLKNACYATAHYTLAIIANVLRMPKDAFGHLHKSVQYDPFVFIQPHNIVLSFVIIGHMLLNMTHPRKTSQ